MNCYATKIEEINQQTLSDLQARMQGMAHLTERDALRVEGAMIVRVDTRRDGIVADYDEKLRAFIEFVLGEYVREGVGELDQAKLPSLLKLKYRTVNEATVELGGVPRIKDAFLGFQRRLYD